MKRYNKKPPTENKIDIGRNPRSYGCTKPRSEYLGDPYMFDFTHSFCPSTCFFITDIDFVIRNCNNDIMLIEKKCKMQYPSKPQSYTYQMLHEFIVRADGTGKIELQGITLDNWQYYGYHLLQFQNSTFENGNVYFDSKQVENEQELAQIFNFNYQRLRLFSSSH